MIAESVRAVQTYYPQIYLACHTRHTKARSSSVRLSPNDSAILAHLDTAHAMSQGDLARHLGVRASTLSAALTRLTRLGYVESRADPKDRRRLRLTLTERGARAMQQGSVLESDRVKRVLERLSERELRTAIFGLEILARACREEMDGLR